MTNKKTFKLGALSLAMASAMVAGSAAALPSLEQFNAPSQSQTAVKLKHQSNFGTQFIIKYKDSSQQQMLMSADLGEMSPAMMNQRAKSFVKNFKSKKANVTPQYVRAMALSNHHVMRVNKKLSALEANALMQEIAASGNVEYIEIDQMLQPTATPSDPRYSDQWHYFENAAGIIQSQSICI